MLAHTLTSFQIAEEMERNREAGQPNIALIPIGSVEQHGPFLPLNADSVIALASAMGLDDKLGGRLFVYPTLDYSNADSGMDFPGTISVCRAGLRKILRGVCHSAQRQGYDGVVWVDGHATNRPALDEVAFEINRSSFSTPKPFLVFVVAAYDFSAQLAARHQLDAGRHADWFEALLFVGAGGELPGGTLPEKDPFPHKLECPPAILGVPLGLRSDYGVIGRVGMDGIGHQLASEVWSELLVLMLERFTNAWKDFQATRLILGE
jgi:creatinine amidohydrolase